MSHQENYEGQRAAVLEHLRKYPHLQITAHQAARVLGRPSASRWRDLLEGLTADGLVTRTEDETTYPHRWLYQGRNPDAQSDHDR